MQDVVAAVVRERLSDVTIVKLLDGGIVFETECSYDKLNFFCFNNIFAVMDILEINLNKASLSENPGPFEYHIRKICGTGKKSGADLRAANYLSERARAVLSENNKKIKSFRLVCSKENKPASVNEKLKQDIENFISRNSALKVDRAGADTEFWFLYRREGFSLFMKRLTVSKDKKLHPGELAPQLAWLLCYIGGLRAGELAADPFCGYGSIPEAALKHFPIKKFFASDIEERCMKITRSRHTLKNERCELRRADAFSDSDFLPHGETDAIISDPPWGQYEESSVPLVEFYEKILSLFSALLKSGGRAVILTAARQELESAALKWRELTFIKIIPILVSGKKAAVYVIKKAI